jgi:hypothetical protein
VGCEGRNLCPEPNDSAQTTTGDTRAGEWAERSIQERHFTIADIAAMWNLSVEFVREIVRGEEGVTEWVRQAPGRRRYRVLRVPQSVLARLYRRAYERHQADATNRPGQRSPRRGK